MSRKSSREKSEIPAPQGVELRIDGNMVIAKGPKGEARKNLAEPKLEIGVDKNTLFIKQDKFSRKEKRIVNTFLAHVKNLINGVTHGYTYKLKVCSTHFPISVSVEGKKVIIKNLFGEKIPRKAEILPDVAVKVDKDIITVDGTSKENVGQTAANIEQACKISKRDRRVFQDGCWITEKAGRKM
jgi:large subunit ribosomal protein L6